MGKFVNVLKQIGYNVYDGSCINAEQYFLCQMSNVQNKCYSKGSGYFAVDGILPLTTLRRETYMYVKNAFPFKDGKRIFTSVCFAKRTAAVVLRCNRYDNVT